MTEIKTAESLMYRINQAIYTNGMVEHKDTMKLIEQFEANVRKDQNKACAESISKIGADGLEWNISKLHAQGAVMNTKVIK